MAAPTVPWGTWLPGWECLAKECDDERVTSTWQPLGRAKSCAGVGGHIVFSNKWPCLTLSSSFAVGKMPPQVCFSSRHIGSSTLTFCSSAEVLISSGDKEFGSVRHFSVARQHSHSLSARNASQHRLLHGIVTILLIIIDSFVTELHTTCLIKGI